jgi:ribulose-bisphosphate carboxylase large chain
MPLSERIKVTYEFRLDPAETPEAAARRIALEQTVELPDGCYPEGIEEAIVGRVERAELLGEARGRAAVTYDPLLAGTEVPQLLNLLFGMVSLLPGTRVVDMELPDALLLALQGPRFGVEGIRSACGAAGRPLLCTSIKPVGLPAGELASIAGALARGGIDVVKDDHGVANQEPARFAERVERCARAVREANAATGGSTQYFPHVTAPVERLPQRLEVAKAAGCSGVLVAPFVTGLDTVRWLAETSGLIVLVHPTFSGAMYQADHGVAPWVLARLLRVLGSDGVTYVNAGGRFPVKEADCEAINHALREPLGTLRPALPVPGGGMDAGHVAHWTERYGMDTMFLFGSSLYAQGDLEEASRRLVEAVRAGSGPEGLL